MDFFSLPWNLKRHYGSLSLLNVALGMTTTRQSTVTSVQFLYTN